MKPVIIAIVGPSGCGKTTMAEFIKKEFGIPTIVSYTTRPMRDNETQGKEHQFVSESEMPQKEEMLAYTQFGGYHYWASHNQVTANGICTYVIDEKGLIMLNEKYGDIYRVFSILVKMDKDSLHADSERIDRDKERVVIPEEQYNVVINNDGTLGEFLLNVRRTVSLLVHDHITNLFQYAKK